MSHDRSGGAIEKINNSEIQNKSIRKAQKIKQMKKQKQSLTPGKPKAVQKWNAIQNNANLFNVYTGTMM